MNSAMKSELKNVLSIVALVLSFILFMFGVIFAVTLKDELQQTQSNQREILISLINNPPSPENITSSQLDRLLRFYTTNFIINYQQYSLTERYRAANLIISAIPYLERAQSDSSSTFLITQGRWLLDACLAFHDQEARAHRYWQSDTIGRLRLDAPDVSGTVYEGLIRSWAYTTQDGREAWQRSTTIKRAVGQCFLLTAQSEANRGNLEAQLEIVRQSSDDDSSRRVPHENVGSFDWDASAVRPAELERLLPRNDRLAFNYLLMAAEGGSDTAQLQLARRYLHGIGTIENLEEAGSWYYSAAQGGNNAAAVEFAELLMDARFPSFEPVLAIDIWRSQIDGVGDGYLTRYATERALEELAEIYLEGAITDQNLLYAHALYSVLSVVSNGRGRSEQQQIAATLTSEELETSRELARTCLESELTNCP